MDLVTAPRQAVALPGPCSRIPAERADVVRQILDQVGDKWTLMVIATLRGGVMRYTDLLRAIPGISERMLSRTLAQLHRDGLVTRTAYAEVPPRVEYALAPLGVYQYQWARQGSNLRPLGSGCVTALADTAASSQTSGRTTPGPLSWILGRA